MNVLIVYLDGSEESGWRWSALTGFAERRFDDPGEELAGGKCESASEALHVGDFCAKARFSRAAQKISGQPAARLT